MSLQRVGSEVSLAFGDTWRPERRPDGVVVLHGTLKARLLIDEPREVTQMRGAVMYVIEPDASAGPVPSPLAALSTARREVSIPVLAYAGRCTAHVMGEIKQPYAFLVWVGRPGEEPVGVTPTIGQPTKDALRLVCAFEGRPAPGVSAGRGRPRAGRTSAGARSRRDSVAGRRRQVGLAAAAARIAAPRRGSRPAPTPAPARRGAGSVIAPVGVVARPGAAAAAARPARRGGARARSPGRSGSRGSSRQPCVGDEAHRLDDVVERPRRR